MIDFAQTRRHAHEAHARNTSANRMIGRVARWLKIRHDRRLLQSMPDYLLSDLGISRGAIEHVTEFGRPRL